MQTVRQRKKIRFQILVENICFCLTEYLKTKEEGLLKFGSNPNPLFSCYNSVPTLIRVLDQDDSIKTMFKEVISDLKSDNINYLFDLFAFTNYAYEKGVFNKVLFASLLNFNPNELLNIKTTKDLKNRIINNLDLIDKLYYLNEEEKEIIKKAIFGKRQLHLNSDLFSYYDFETYKTILNEGTMEKGLRKYGESFKIVTYIILNHGKMILIWNRRLYKSDQSSLRSIICDYKFFPNVNFDLKIDLCCENIKFILHYTLGLIEFYEFELIITDEELNHDFIVKQINNHRKENGISIKKEIWFYYISYEIDYLQ